MRSMTRCTALTLSSLSKQERHGKRLDKTSKKRVIRDEKAHVYRGLDLLDLYENHVKGVRQNARATKPVLHFIMRFPPEVLTGEAGKHFVGNKSKRQKIMLAQAIKFVDKTHGGNAVFAARIDRDEAGETIVDVFACPKYEKRTKRTKLDEVGVMWSSATKYGKELALKHQDEIRRRHPKAKAAALTGPRMVGIALNSEYRDFFEKMNGIKLEPKVEKHTSVPDRLETEAFKELQDEKDRLEALASSLAERQKKIDADKIAIAESQKQIADLNADLKERESRLKKSLANVERMKSAAIRVLNDLSGVVKEWTSILGLTVPKQIKQLSELEEAVDALKRDNIERIEEHSLENQDYDEASFERPPAPE